ncbi:MAG: ABC transporter permease [Nitrospirae bacterium]|nr:ABC transporter permease [Nitrospirota bacterium]
MKRNNFHLLFYFIKKDIRTRFAGSGLGLLWTLLIPVVQILLFWFVFSGIMKSRPYANTSMPYIYFLLSSFFFWLAFSEGVMKASSSIIENAEMVKKISFPVILLPITAITSSYLLNLGGFLLFLFVYSLSTSFSPLFVMVLPVLLLQFLFSLGLGLLLAALMPYVRDLSQLLSYFIQGMFFVSPIIYSLEAIPDRFKIIFSLNPLTYFVSSYHTILLFRKIPDLTFLGIICLLSLGAIAGGLFIFDKLRSGFADVL